MATRSDRGSRLGSRVTLVVVSIQTHRDPAAQANPGPPAGTTPRRTSRGWPVATPLALLLVGSLFVISARNSDGTDLRPGRYTDLAGLVRSESDRTQTLRDRVGELTDEVDSLGETVRDVQVDRLRAEVASLSAPAGLTAQQGEGLRITLSDAPEEIIEATQQDLNLLVVHQQDIQAVVNALWKGGASAVTIAGQRIVSTTGIKCEGNAVQLGGIPYPQPYVITAVGDQAALDEAVAEDSYLRNYRQQSEIADIAIGWDLQLEDELIAPAYDGLLDLGYAEPIAS